MKGRRFLEIDRRNGRMLNVVVNENAGLAPNEEKIQIYSDILRSTSPQLKRMVQNLPANSVDLVIRDIPRVVMETLIDYICQTFGRGKTHLLITDARVYHLMSASIKLGLDDVQHLCDEHLKQMEVTNENCVEIFIKTKNWTRVSGEKKQQALEHLLTHMAQVMTEPPFLNLKIKHLIAVIKDGESGVKCSQEILLAGASKWLFSNGKQPQIESRALQLLAEFPMEQHRKKLMETLHSVNPSAAQKLAYDFMVNGKSENPAPVVVLNPVPLDQDQEREQPSSSALPVPVPSAPQCNKRKISNSNEQSGVAKKKSLPKGVEGYRRFWCPFCPELGPTPSSRVLAVHLKAVHWSGRKPLLQLKACSNCSGTQIFTSIFDWTTHIIDHHSQRETADVETSLENNGAQSQTKFGENGGRQGNSGSNLISNSTESQVKNQNQGLLETTDQVEKKSSSNSLVNLCAPSHVQIQISPEIKSDSSASVFVPSSSNSKSTPRPCPLRFKKIKEDLNVEK